MLICHIQYTGALRHSIDVFQLIFGTQYFCLSESLDESMFTNTSLTEKCNVTKFFKK